MTKAKTSKTVSTQKKQNVPAGPIVLDSRVRKSVTYFCLQVKKSIYPIPPGYVQHRDQYNVVNGNLYTKPNNKPLSLADAMEVYPSTMTLKEVQEATNKLQSALVTDAKKIQAFIKAEDNLRRWADKEEARIIDLLLYRAQQDLVRSAGWLVSVQKETEVLKTKVQDLEKELEQKVAYLSALNIPYVTRAERKEKRAKKLKG